ncbi:hypothetical protein [Kribbella shirazensis]|uniref:Uncharacterized protein n=1 Tax=Kribbella shirazensis TaxID=1105143 RepID=A0A7X5V5L8_9ACTN|nr:hypothetical protein [Kribbella shirazensis]NIK54353.1 hypothetical protein [Kribbella shirazensis]
MTNQLKDLMSAAVDEEAPYTPDVDALVRDGRRQVRRRRTAGVVATLAVVAAASVVTTYTINRSPELPVTPETTMPSVVPGGSSGTCTTADGTGVPAWNRWQLVLYVQDTFGMSLVYRSPDDPNLIAFCTTQRGDGTKLPEVPGRAKNDGIVLRKSAANGRGALPGSSVTSVFGPVPSGTPPRVTVETADGHVGVATVKNGFFAYRRVEHSAWPGPLPQAIVRFKYPGTAEYVVASR